MTRMMEEAFSKVAKLPKKDQDAIAAWLLEELASEQRWQKSFRKSRGALALLAEEALAEHRQERTEELDVSRL